MYELHVEDSFAAAHFLREYRGKCERLHGHNWKIELDLVGEKLTREGFLIDFCDAKKILKQALVELDHECLNEKPPFDRINPTTENISRYLFERIGPMLPEGVRVKTVRCWETSGCSATYREPESPRAAPDDGLVSRSRATDEKT